MPSTRKNTYIAPAGGAASTPSINASSCRRMSRAAPEAREHSRRSVLRHATRPHPRAARTPLNTTCCMDKLAKVGHQLRRRDNPAQAPARHQPRFRKIFYRKDDRNGSARPRKDGAQARERRQALVDVVGVDQCRGGGNTWRIAALIVAPERPPGRIVGEPISSAPGRGQRIDQPIDVEPPAVIDRLESDAHDSAPRILGIWSGSAVTALQPTTRSSGTRSASMLTSMPTCLTR